jgi:hypothetical protein
MFSMAARRGLIPPGLRAYFKIMEAWRIGENKASALLGFDHRPTDRDITIDPLRRISHTIAIYKALHLLLSQESADTWVMRPNSAEPFNGRISLEILEEGTRGFEMVRIYLTSALQ